MADDVYALNVFVSRYEIRQYFELHDRMGIEAEMPEAALFVGKNGVNRGVVYLQNFLACVAAIVAGNSLIERIGHRRAIALENDTQLFAHRAAKLQLSLCGTLFVVQGDNLDRTAAEDSAFRVVEVVDGKLKQV